MLQKYSDRSITLQELKKKSIGACPHPYLRPIPLDSSFHPDRSDTYHFLPFFFCGPDPLLDILIWDLYHWIPLFVLIAVVPITF
jgi:hypothetical protein